MNILDKIIQYKKTEVAKAKLHTTESDLRSFENFSRKKLSAVESIKQQEIAIIAEHKRRSPSKGVINASLNLESIVSAYAKAGAAAISVLTDQNFFGGDLKDLAEARKLVEIPLLRKDFTIDSYQLVEAKAYGADFILLIAKALDPILISELAQAAHELNLEVLLEVHHKSELDNLDFKNIDMIGVNNRNLDDFSVDISISENLANFIPSNILKVSESGLKSGAEISRLSKAGYNAFLIGESFMKTSDPGSALTDFIKESSLCLAR